MYLPYFNIELIIKEETGHGNTSCRCKRSTCKSAGCLPVTADKNGVPNVCLMGFVKVRNDETLIMAKVFWQKTEANLNENPKAALSA